jgi:DNA-binding NarL/FixJ family response regulator
MSHSGSTIRLLIAEDHPVMREGIRASIRNATHIEVVGEARDGLEACELFRSLRPDVTLMDLQMPKMSGVDAVEQIQREFPGAAIVVLTTYKTDALALRALRAGVRGYLLKTAAAAEIIRAIETVSIGRRLISPEIASEIAMHMADESLTQREIAVLKLVAAGNSNREAAEQLAIGVETVKQHLKNIASKLGTADRAHAVNIAIKRGIIEP